MTRRMDTVMIMVIVMVMSISMSMKTVQRQLMIMDTLTRSLLLQLSLTRFKTHLTLAQTSPLPKKIILSPTTRSNRTIAWTALRCRSWEQKMCSNTMKILSVWQCSATPQPTLKSIWSILSRGLRCSITVCWFRAWLLPCSLPHYLASIAMRQDTTPHRCREHMSCGSSSFRVRWRFTWHLLLRFLMDSQSWSFPIISLKCLSLMGRRLATS